MYWKSNYNFRDVRLLDLYIPREKLLNYLQIVETLIRECGVWSGSGLFANCPLCVRDRGEGGEGWCGRRFPHYIGLNRKDAKDDLFFVFADLTSHFTDGDQRYTEKQLSWYSRNLSKVLAVYCKQHRGLNTDYFAQKQDYVLVFLIISAADDILTYFSKKIRVYISCERSVLPSGRFT